MVNGRASRVCLVGRKEGKELEMEMVRDGK